jgi:hypothetical protein
MKFITYCFIVLIACYGCNSGVKNSSPDVPIEKIDFASFKESPGSGLPDSLFSGSQFIKLKSKDIAGTFGVISKLKVWLNQIYILDSRLRLLVIYDMNGNLIGKVGNRGKGLNDYGQIASFDIAANGDIYLIDGHADKLQIYSRDRNLKNTTKLSFEADNIKCLSNGNLLFAVSAWNKKGNAGDRFVITDNKLEVLESFYKYDNYRDDSYELSSYKFITVQNEIFYNKPVDNNIYVFTSESKPSKIYQFDFGKSNVPDEDKIDIQKKLSEYRNYRLLKNFTAFTPKYIVGMLLDKYESRMFVIDRSEKTVYFNHTRSGINSGDLMDFDGQNVVSFSRPADVDNPELIKDLPQDVIDHLKNDEYVVQIRKLK